MMDVFTIKDELIQASNAVGVSFPPDMIQVIDRGKPHKPASLTGGNMAIYMFEYNDEILKIGKVAAKSNARFQSQHYNPQSSQSNLAKSILSDDAMRPFNLSPTTVGDWIKTNTRRIDVLLDVDLGVFALNFVEAALLLKFTPRYEGYVGQR